MTPGTHCVYFVCLCWGLTSQSTIFQSCQDGATTSWVINQYFRGVKCLAQGHNTVAVGIEPPTSRSGIRHSTTEPPRSPPLRLYFDEPQKKWNSFFYINEVAKKSWKLMCLVITFMAWHQSNVRSANQQFHLFVMSLMHNIVWTSVIHQCMNLVDPKLVNLRKLLTM